jgi:phosphate transport system substrate-binding protein
VIRLIRLQLCAAIALAAALAPPAAADQSTVRIGGTGIALGAMHEFGLSLAAAEPGIRVEVLPSMGTAGGIKALAAGVIDIAIAARPLRPEERATGATEAACMTTALVFASSHNAAADITRAELPGLYADAAPTWPDGTPLKIILRSRSGSENPSLTAAMPEMGPALDAAFKRHGVAVASTDQDNAKLALQVPGSLALMTLLQSKAERLDLRVLRFDGVAASAATIADKTYPFPIRICALLPSEPSSRSAPRRRNSRAWPGTSLSHD